MRMRNVRGKSHLCARVKRENKMASGNQFSDDSPFADKYGPPPVGKQIPHFSLENCRTNAIKRDMLALADRVF